MDPERESSTEVAPADDEYSSAFAELTTGTTPPAEVVPPVAEETPPAEVVPPVAEETPPAQVEPPVAEETPPPHDVPPVAEETPPTAETPEQARIRELEAQLAAVKVPPVAPVAPVAETPPAAPVYTAEEEAAITKYRADWPDVAAA